MSWHGQINRTIWEITEAIKRSPDEPRYRRELLRAQFLQHFEHDKAFHVPRDDRTFLFLHDTETPACLLLHGAQGTPAEMRDLGNHLYSHGVSVYCPRLARADAKEGVVSWESWVTTAEIALDAVTTYSKTTFIAGLSLGATIALILSERKPVSGVVLLAPALFPRGTLKARLLQVCRVVTPTVFYHFAGWTGEVLKAMDHARKHAKKIGPPVIALQAADDRHLSARGLKFIRRHARHDDTDVRLLPVGTHALTRGEAKAEVFDAVATFIERNSRSAGSPVVGPGAERSEGGARSDPS